MQRLRIAIVAGIAGGAMVFARGVPPTRDPTAFAALLGKSAEGTVAVDEIRWEASGGVVMDAALGRKVLFLARDVAGGSRDVWRARVRLTPEGRPFWLTDVHNLTSTPLGDDHLLIVRGDIAAFATSAFGQEQSVTVLDLRGESSADEASGASWLRGFMDAVTHYQETGSLRGIGRLSVTMDQPAQHVGLMLHERMLAVDWVEGRALHRAEVDPASGRTVPEVAGLRIESPPKLEKRFIHWAVDTVRAVPWIGPRPIAWLEEQVFALRDDAKRLAFKFHGSDPKDTLAAPLEKVSALLPQAHDATSSAEDAAMWPPPAIRSIWKKSEPGEGEWRVPKMPWIRRPPGVVVGAPSPFYHTYVRPDEARPYADVLLVAMDMRQLDLEMEAGAEDPKPLTGPNGTGRIPRDPNVALRVAGAFNGAFKAEHGHYGMMVHNRILLPPQPQAASVIVLRDKRVGMGTWGGTTEFTEVAGVRASDIVSLRQNMEPLVERGVFNPSGRTLWGFTLPGTGMQTERSGMCVTGAGHLVYAWSDDASAKTIGMAMQMAGCVYGMHLDMNPHHAGFLFATIDDPKGRRYRSEWLTPRMEIATNRFIEYSPKDFFYLLVHDPRPPSPEGVEWIADPGSQPTPSWMPGLWTARTDSRDGTIELFAIEPGRMTFRLRAGDREPDLKTGIALPRGLPAADAQRVMFALGLGVSSDRHPFGLAIDGRQFLPWSGRGRASPGGRSMAILTANAEGRLGLRKSSEVTVESHGDAVELPLLASEGVLVSETMEDAPPAKVRGAIGITADGRVLVARGNVSRVSSLAHALLDLGCASVAELNRGGHGRVFRHRSGTTEGPQAHYDESVLYGIASVLKPRAFHFEE